MKTVRDLKQGETFKFTTGSTAVYVCNHYDKGSKRFSVSRYDDVNTERFLKPTTAVTTEFEF